MVTNISSEELTIPKATVLSVAEEISEPLVDRINAGNGSGSGLMTSQQRKEKHGPESEVVTRETRPPL